MRVVEIKEFGAPEMLVPTSRPDPVAPAAGSGEVLIKVLAAGINRPDVLQRKGHYPVPAGASDIPRHNDGDFEQRHVGGCCCCGCCQCELDPSGHVC